MKLLDDSQRSPEKGLWSVSQNKLRDETDQHRRVKALMGNG